MNQPYHAARRHVHCRTWSRNVRVIQKALARSPAGAVSGSTALSVRSVRGSGIAFGLPNRPISRESGDSRTGSFVPFATWAASVSTVVGLAPAFDSAPCGALVAATNCCDWSALANVGVGLPTDRQPVAAKASSNRQLAGNVDRPLMVHLRDPVGPRLISRSGVRAKGDPISAIGTRQAPAIWSVLPRRTSEPPSFTDPSLYCKTKSK